MSPWVILRMCNNEICGLAVITLVEFDKLFLGMKDKSEFSLSTNMEAYMYCDYESYGEFDLSG